MFIYIQVEWEIDTTTMKIMTIMFKMKVEEQQEEIIYQVWYWQALLLYTLLFSLSEACGAKTYRLAQIWVQKAEIDIII